MKLLLRLWFDEFGLIFTVDSVHIILSVSGLLGCDKRRDRFRGGRAHTSAILDEFHVN